MSHTDDYSDYEYDMDEYKGNSSELFEKSRRALSILSKRLLQYNKSYLYFIGEQHDNECYNDVIFDDIVNLCNQALFMPNEIHVIFEQYMQRDSDTSTLEGYIEYKNKISNKLIPHKCDYRISDKIISEINNIKNINIQKMKIKVD